MISSKISLFFMLRLSVVCVLTTLSIIDLTLGLGLHIPMIVYLSLVILIVLIALLKKRYGSLCFIHPGVWFAASWIVAIASYVLLQTWNYVPIEDIYLLTRLMWLVMSSAIFFAIVSYYSPKPKARNSLDSSGHLMGSQFLLSSSILISLMGAIINWVGVGAPINYVDNIRQQWLQGIPPVTAAAWYPYHLSFAASFYAGWVLPNALSVRRELKRSYNLSVLCLAISALLWSLGTGGRQVTGFVMLYFLIGIAFKLALTDEVKQAAKLIIENRSKVIIVFISVVMVFALFASFTNSMRAKQQNDISERPFSGIPGLSQIGFFITYMGGTLMTSQAYGLPQRRNTAETGPVSINGLLDWGFNDYSVYKLFHIRRIDAMDTNPERALARYGQKLASGTRNIFYDLEADFGYTGAFLGIIVLVVVSQGVFVVTINTYSYRRIVALAPLVFIIMYWGYSHQLSLMMHGQLKWTVTSFFLWSLGNYRINRRL